jgi:hypothetical protein
MGDEIELFEAGRAALVAGDVRPEDPPAEYGPRWGAAAVLRPVDPVVGPLAELANSLGAAAGDGHWAHREGSLHFTLRALEHHRSSIPVNDARRIAYAEALDAAAEGIPPARVQLRGVCPHPAGVIAVGYPLDGVLATLQARFAEELRARGVAAFESWVRDRWYVSLLHFAGPVAELARVAAWCEERRDLRIGVVALDAVEVVRWHFTGVGVRAEALHMTRLDRGSAVESTQLAQRSSHNPARVTAASRTRPRGRV